MLYVPETRDKYEQLYEKDCKQLIGYIIGQTDLKNPYSKIVTLHGNKPKPSSEGTTAFLVHNLAKESIAKYVFFSDDTGKSAALKLRGMSFLGQVGSYTTNISINDDESFELNRNKYTVW